MDRPSSPLFKRASTGEDKWTQVFGSEPEVFDFDGQVQLLCCLSVVGAVACSLVMMDVYFLHTVCVWGKCGACRNAVHTQCFIGNAFMYHRQGRTTGVCLSCVLPTCKTRVCFCHVYCRHCRNTGVFFGVRVRTSPSRVPLWVSRCSRLSTH